jgi:hypothetical protein
MVANGSLYNAIEKVASLLDLDDYVQLLDYYRAVALLKGYHERWKNQTYVPIEIARDYTHGIYSPDGGPGDQTPYVRAGKKDVIVQDQHGDRFLMEHKTTVYDIYPHDVDYWGKMAFDSQISGYMLAELLEDRGTDACVYDVIKKTKTKPKKLAKKVMEGIAETHTYFGYALTENDKCDILVQPKETAAMYGARFYDDVKANPETYFQRRIIHRSTEQLIDYGKDLWQISRSVEACDKDPDKFYKNTGSCYDFNVPCKYLGICSGHTSIADLKWEGGHSETQHPELNLDYTNLDPQKVLTHSSIEMFLKCRRKFYYHHRLNLRKSQERSNALFFGDLIHQGLEAWFTSQLPQTGAMNDTDTSEHPAGVTERPATSVVARDTRRREDDATSWIA